MAQYPSNPYWEVYDVNNKYKEPVFRAGFGLQSRELNEMGARLRHAIDTLTSTIHNEGSIISGGETQMVGDQFTINDSIFYARTYFSNIPTTTFTIGTTETDTIGVGIEIKIITEAEDPSLRSPAANTRNYNQPGAHRKQVDATWMKENAKPVGFTGVFYPIHKFKDGQLEVETNIATSELSSIVEKTIADYDKAANGDYVIDGFQPSFLYDDVISDEHILSISEGTCHVDGYAITATNSYRFRVPYASDTESVNNEPVNFTSDGWYNLRWNPIAALQEVNGEVQVTQTITHGNFSGVSDLLPNSPVVEIISVTSTDELTTYSEGTDWIIRGDYIDWSPGGAEPATGSNYKITYVYQDTVETSISANREQIYLTGFKVGSTVLVDYTFYIPRIDRLVISRYGEIKQLKGTPDKLEPIPPQASTGLQIGTVKLLYGKVPEITVDSFRSFKMSDIQVFSKQLNDQQEQIARLNLQQRLNTTDPTLTKTNVFTDSFTSPALRDSGVPQTAITEAGMLEPFVASYDAIVRTFEQGMITLPFSETNFLTQDAFTKERLVNEFERIDLPPGEFRIYPREYVWTAQTLTKNQTLRTITQTSTSTTYASGRWNQTIYSTVGVDVSSHLVNVNTKIVNSTENFAIPPIDLKVQGWKFNASEQVDVTFDGLDVGNTTADTNGLANLTFTIPDNVPSGAKNVVLTGAESGLTCIGTFRSQPQVKIVINNFNRVVKRRVRRTVIRRWRDPIAETFVPTETMNLTSAELIFTNTTSSYVDVFITETINGYPNTEKSLGFARLYAEDIIANQWVKATFDNHVFVEEGINYSLVIICGDTNLKIRTAKMGEYDLNNSKYVTTQPYLTGVLFNSSNAAAWSAIQDEDLTFKLNRAEYSLNTYNVDVGTISVDDCTDLLLSADVENYPETRCTFKVVLIDRQNEEYLIAPDGSVNFTSYTGDVKLTAELVSTNTKLSPTIDGDVQLGVGKVYYPMTYSHRSISFDGSALHVLLDSYEPSGTTTKVYYQSNEISLVVNPTDDWMPNGLDEIGIYYYVGSDLQGYKPAKVNINSSTAEIDDNLDTLEDGNYTWGDYDSLGSNALYIREPLLEAMSQGWIQSSTQPLEFYYNGTNILNPTRVKIGSTELTRGTLGGLGEGEFAYGDNDTIEGNRLYVRMPASEVVDLVVDPSAYNSDAEFVAVTYSPGTQSNGYVVAREWIGITRTSTTPIDDGFLEVKFETGTLVGDDIPDENKILIECNTTDTNQRPIVKNLKTYVV